MALVGDLALHFGAAACFPSSTRPSLPAAVAIVTTTGTMRVEALHRPEAVMVVVVRPGDGEVGGPREKRRAGAKEGGNGEIGALVAVGAVAVTPRPPRRWACLGTGCQHEDGVSVGMAAPEDLWSFGRLRGDIQRPIPPAKAWVLWARAWGLSVSVILWVAVMPYADLDRGV